MKKLLLSTILLAISNYLICQVTFEKSYEVENGYNGICVEQTLDNGYAVLTQEIGITIYNSLIKTDKFGNIVWVNQQFNDYYLYPEAICLTPDSGYLATGGVFDYALFKIVKLDKMGDTIWLKSDLFGSSSVYGASVIPTNDNNYLIGAETFIKKINEVGDTLWSNHIKIVSGHITKIIQSDNGGFVISGKWGSDPNVYGFDFDGWIVKTDSLGNQIWRTTFDNGNYLNSICQSDDGGYVSAGFKNPEGVAFIKIDSLGNVLWENTFDPGMAVSAVGHSICSTPDGNYVIAAEIDNLDGGYLIKIDESGEIIWSYLYGDRLSDVKVTNDDGLIAVGTKNYKVYLIKTNMDGLISSIDENNKQDIFNLELYPNPVNSTARLCCGFSSAKTLSVCLYNTSGLCLKSWEFNNQQTGQQEFTLDLSNLSPGIYFLRLQAGNEVVTKKVVKL